MVFDWLFVFSPLGLSVAFAGSALGIIWGALPGLSSNMAMALLVGFTYNLSTEVAVVFLIAVWIGTELAAPSRRFSSTFRARRRRSPPLWRAIPWRSAAKAGWPSARRSRSR